MKTHTSQHSEVSFCNWNQIAKSRFVRARPEDSKLEIRTELIDEKNVAAAAR